LNWNRRINTCENERDGHAERLEFRKTFLYICRPDYPNSGVVLLRKILSRVPEKLFFGDGNMPADSISFQTSTPLGGINNKFFKGIKL
jgi:hypothetical protein